MTLPSASIHILSQLRIQELFQISTAVLTDFSYGKVYPLRTVVEEAQSTQPASVLDSIGVVISATTAVPLAEPGSSTHAVFIQIGNKPNLRATDTLPESVFVRPAALTEPRVEVTRLR